MTILLRDLRYAVRMFLKNPTVAIIAIITLALGIGANAAIFSVVNAVLLRPLPYDHPEQLVVLRENKIPQFPEFSVSPGNFLDWQKQSTVFESLIASMGTAYTLVAGDQPERLRGARISAGTFEMLRVAPVIGRTFLAEEDQPGRDRVVILSEALWKRKFGSDPNVVGQSLTLSGNPYTVIGVMPATFEFPADDTELWAPIAFTARQAQQHGSHYVSVSGRLKPGVTLGQANEEMIAIAARLAEQYPASNAGWSVDVFSVQEYLVRDIRVALVVLLGAVGLVLLIACANVANLQLSRAAARQKELAIRSALGASRWRVVRQLLTESVLLSMLGGTAGLLLALWGTHALLSLAPDDLQGVKDASLDAKVLVFTFLISVITGLIFGLAPALQAGRVRLNEILKEGTRGSTSGHHRVRGALVIAEVSIALVLLVGAGLLIRSFQRLQQVNPGFNPNNAVAVNIDLPGTKYPNGEKQLAFYNDLISRLSALPGVKSVGATQTLPIQSDFLVGFSIKGRPPAAPGEDVSTNYYAVTSGYFEAMGIPLVRGRLFDEHDNLNAPKVAVINEALAQKFFPDEDPIGKGIRLSQGNDSYREIIGIVGDVKQYGLARPTTWQTYEPFLQMPFGSMSVVLRTEGDPASVTSAVRGEVLAVDKEQPVSRIRTLEALVDLSISQQRFSMLLLSVFGAIALILAVVGLYGVMSHSVSQRTHEIGIRAALGAQRSDVIRLVVGQGMILALVGVAIGLGAAYALTRVMASLLFGVGATDPLTFAAISVLLTGVALGACLVPARRALRVDPIVALRYE